MKGSFPLAAVASGAAAAILASSVLDPTSFVGLSLPFQTYGTAADVPEACYRKNAAIYGRVVRVFDGDTMRVRHLPLYPLLRSGRYEGRLSDNTISARVYGVDAPEIAKFGNPSMPMAEEAKKWTMEKVDGKVVRVKLLRKDQYNRAIGEVTTRGPIPIVTETDVSLGLAENGLATLYTGGGAEYDGKRAELEKKIEYAKRTRKGIWMNGSNGVMSPAEYKRAIREATGK